MKPISTPELGRALRYSCMLMSSNQFSGMNRIVSGSVSLITKQEECSRSSYITGGLELLRSVIEYSYDCINNNNSISPDYMVCSWILNVESGLSVLAVVMLIV